jgi:hypothetical protein
MAKSHQLLTSVETHMCPLKLLPVNYRYVHPCCWPFCAHGAGVSSRGADLRWMADGANEDLFLRV